MRRKKLETAKVIRHEAQKDWGTVIKSYLNEKFGAFNVGNERDRVVDSHPTSAVPLEEEKNFYCFHIHFDDDKIIYRGWKKTKLFWLLHGASVD